MATSQGKREILVTARAAADLSNASLSGKNTPYLEITIMDSTVKTNPDKESSVNPVWDELFMFKVPGASPGEEPLVIHVTAKHQVTAPLIPDSTIGKGSVPLVQLWSKGSEEVKIPLTDSSGQPAGAAFIGVKVETPKDEREIRKFWLNYSNINMV
jgi:Ca2+-dependent lipid-binding protein